MGKTKGRPKFGFFIFDCPSDHEVDGHLLSESDAIKAVLSNRDLGSRLKSVRCTTVDSFRSVPTRKYPGIRYVHLGGHASKSGIAFIGGSVKWAEVASTLCDLFPPLVKNKKRVLTLSCCYSQQGVADLKPMLKGHFTAIYHFKPEKIGFAEAMTTWCMFYLRKRLSRPLAAVVTDINTFMKQDIIRMVGV
jgi:hypothetical protein